jgi:hypothetical protein
MENMTSTDTQTTFDDLRGRVAGQVLTPADGDYETSRLIFYRHLGRRPAVIVRPAHAADVAAAILFARRNDLEIAVRAGGHSGAGFGTVDDGLVIDVRDLDSIEVDREGLSAWAGAGVTAGQLTQALGAHGLVTGFGDTGSVGIAGITLGGGQGFLSRKHGLTIDNLLAVELVTADGEVLRVDAENHPDLFWAVRGGGGGFGVATRFQYRLHELPEVVGGMLLLPATPDTITRFMDLALGAPEELGVIANVMPAPPMPFVPEEHRGELVIMALMTYAGGPAAAEPVLAPFRAIANPLADFLAPMPYSGMFQPEDDSYHPIATSWTAYAQDFDRDDAQLIVDTLTSRLADPDVQAAVVQLRLLGGAIARVAPDATAYAHRDRRIMLNTAAIVSGVEALEAQKPWLRALATDLADGTSGAYVGFVLDPGHDRIHEIYPGATYDRLAQVKRQWDPANVFHHNHTVAP